MQLRCKLAADGSDAFKRFTLQRYRGAKGGVLHVTGLHARDLCRDKSVAATPRSTKSRSRSPRSTEKLDCPGGRSLKDGLKPPPPMSADERAKFEVWR